MEVIGPKEFTMSIEMKLPEPRTRAQFDAACAEAGTAPTEEAYRRWRDVARRVSGQSDFEDIFLTLEDALVKGTPIGDAAKAVGFMSDPLRAGKISREEIKRGGGR